jgi:hypothetical protein
VQEVCAVEGCLTTNTYKTLGTLCTAHWRLYGGHQVPSAAWSAEVRAAWSDEVKAASEKHAAIFRRNQEKERERQQRDPKRVLNTAGSQAYAQSEHGRALALESKRRSRARAILAKNEALQERIAELIEDDRVLGGRTRILTDDELIDTVYDKILDRSVASFDHVSLSDLSEILMPVGEVLRKATSYTGSEPATGVTHICKSLGLEYSEESLGHWTRKGTTQLMPDLTKIPKQVLLSPTELDYKVARVSAARHSTARHSVAQRGAQVFQDSKTNCGLVEAYIQALHMDLKVGTQRLWQRVRAGFL